MKTQIITAKIPADAWETLVKLVPQYAAYAVPDRRRGFKRAPLNPGTVAELVPIEPSPFLVQTTSEALTAYADCAAIKTPDAMRRRNLSFKSTHPVTIAEARAIFAKAIIGGYNDFTAKALRHLPQDRMCYLAREGSPCLYVLGETFDQSPKLMADEFDFYPEKYVKDYGTPFTIPGPVTRVWWD